MCYWWSAHGRLDSDLYLCFLYFSCIYFVFILCLYCTSGGNWELLLMVSARAVRRWCDCHALTSPSRVWSPGRPPKTKLTLFFYFTFDLFINVVKVFCGQIILKWLSQVWIGQPVWNLLNLLFSLVFAPISLHEKLWSLIPNVPEWFVFVSSHIFAWGINPECYCSVAS